MVSLTIDSKTIEVSEGTTVLQAAQQAGIHVPTLCDHPELTPYGGCRLCVVEVQGMRVPIASCTLPASQGMVVSTDTEKVRAARKFVLTLLFSERNHFCPFCQVSGGDCELQNAAYGEDMTHWPLQPNWNNYKVDASNDFYVFDENRCILCRRCIRACGELVGNFTLSNAERGAKSVLVADYGIPLGESSCVSCGTCVQVCPTGALIDRQSAYQGREKQVEHTLSICIGCSVGCGIDIITRDNRLVRIDGQWEAPVNDGVMCKNGRFHPLADQRVRLTKPMVRTNGSLVEASWEEALATVTERLIPLQGKGSAGVAALVSTRLPAEALSLFKEVFANGLKSSMVTGIEEGQPTALATAFASETGKPFEGSLADLKAADCVVAIGVDLVRSHEVAGFFVKRNLPAGTRLVVIDPGENSLDDLATCTMKAAKGTDLDVLHGLKAAIVKLGLAKGASLAIDPTLIMNDLIEKTGISAEEFLKAATLLGYAERPVFVYGKGITSRGTLATLKSLVELAALTGASLLSVKGEANSLAAAQYGLDKPFKVNGQQAAYIALGDDAAHERLVANLEKVPFLVVQASYESDLTAKADVVLPVETWAEQEGHYLNLEGRLQKASKAIAAPETVRSSVEVLNALAGGLQLKPQANWKEALYQRVPAVAITEG